MRFEPGSGKSSCVLFESFESTVYGRRDTVLALLQADATVDAKDKNERTPLWAAARNGHASTVLVLLQAGARVDAKNKWGETALDIAKEKQHAEVVAILRAAGARE
jgi:ankyrin repeat protein